MVNVERVHFFPLRSIGATSRSAPLRSGQNYRSLAPLRSETAPLHITAYDIFFQIPRTNVSAVHAKKNWSTTDHSTNVFSSTRTESCLGNARNPLRLKQLFCQLLLIQGNARNPLRLKQLFCQLLLIKGNHYLSLPASVPLWTRSLTL
ncbi:unnamed protein product, partial [Cyprideis torosa]